MKVLLCGIIEIVQEIKHLLGPPLEAISKIKYVPLNTTRVDTAMYKVEVRISPEHLWVWLPTKKKVNKMLPWFQRQKKMAIGHFSTISTIYFSLICCYNFFCFKSFFTDNLHLTSVKSLYKATLPISSFLTSRRMVLLKIRNSCPVLNPKP